MKKIFSLLIILLPYLVFGQGKYIPVGNSIHSTDTGRININARIDGVLRLPLLTSGSPKLLGTDTKGDIISLTTPAANNVQIGVSNTFGVFISPVGLPLSGNDLVIKQYVDAAIAGINPAQSVDAATTPSSTFIGYIYNNGTAGVGATLTAGSTGTITFDGHLTAIGERILFKDLPTHNQNGVYLVTTAGAVGVTAVFTRATDYNTSSNIDNTGAIPIINGSINMNTSWLLITSVSVIGTDPLNYTQLSYVPPNLLHNNLTATHIFVGNAANIATDVAVSGDFNISSAGLATISNLAVSTAKIAANAVTLTKLDNTNANAQRPLVSQSSASPIWNAYAIPASVGSAGKIPYSDGSNWVMSSPTLPLSSAPTAGNILMSDATNWTSVSPIQQTTVANAGSTLSITSADIRTIEKIITAQTTTPLTIANPTGTFREMHKLIIRIYGSSSISLNFDTQFRNGDVLLPLATDAGKEMYMEFVRNTNNSSIRWDCVGVSSNY